MFSQDLLIKYIIPQLIVNCFLSWLSAVACSANICYIQDLNNTKNKLEDAERLIETQDNLVREMEARVQVEYNVPLIFTQPSRSTFPLKYWKYWHILKGEYEDYIHRGIIDNLDYPFSWVPFLISSVDPLFSNSQNNPRVKIWKKGSNEDCLSDCWK